jgi:hypothetical protein
VDRAEAEAIYEQGREVVVAVLLRMDEQIRRLEERVARQDERIAELERKLNRSSRNPALRGAPIRPRRRRVARIGRGVNAVLRVAMRATGVRCCPRGLSMRSSSTGRSAATAGTSSARANGFRSASRRATRSKSCRRSTLGCEHRAQRVCCPECGRRTRAALPEEVARSSFGSRLEAAVATLSVPNRVSPR